MRIINKKYLLIILLVGIIITDVILFRQKEKDNVISKQSVNNKTMAMYIGKDNNYKEYNGNSFPKGYDLNVEMSKCVDNNGKEVDNILSYKDGAITVTSGRTTFCYLYFDEKENLSNICNGSTMQECMSSEDKLNKIKTIDNLSSETKGNMYRYQGQAIDVDNNYICFGTSDRNKCISDTDHYMYRIIGIEESGRIKVIKKEALNNGYQWYSNDYDNIKLPDSIIFVRINGEKFLKNSDYIPEGWEEKIAKNTWTYGDMLENDTLGAKQLGEGLYETESGLKSTKWNEKSTEEEGGITGLVEWEGNKKYPKGTVLYYKTKSEIWSDTIDAKISLMYLHDYSYSVSDEAKCSNYYGESEFSKCKTGWIHLSQNDSSAPSEHEWTMSRYGWHQWYGAFAGFVIANTGYTSNGWLMTGNLSVRPVFYIESSQILLSGLGTIENPFIIE